MWQLPGYTYLAVSGYVCTTITPTSRCVIVLYSYSASVCGTAN